MAVPIPNSVLPTSRQTYCCRVAITNIPAAGAHTPATIRPLLAQRPGDNLQFSPNRRVEALICTRNDVPGNLAVLLTAVGVFGTGTGWPDIIVAAIMSSLALQGPRVVIRQSLGELRSDRKPFVCGRVGISPRPHAVCMCRTGSYMVVDWGINDDL